MLCLEVGTFWKLLKKLRKNVFKTYLVVFFFFTEKYVKNCNLFKLVLCILHIGGFQSLLRRNSCYGQAVSGAILHKVVGKLTI
jgi:hypothetical protein